MVKKLTIEYKSPQWYALRKNRLGGSDASTVLGYNKHRSRIQLWREMITPEPINTPPPNAFAEYGTKAEAPLAELFKLDFPNWTFTDTKNTVYIDDENGFQMASLDLLITDENGRIGVGEIKTANDFGRAKKEWAYDHIPDGYYCQILHYFSVIPNAEFAVVMAYIRNNSGATPYAETIYRTIERTDCEADIEYIYSEEQKFMRHVKNKTMPPEKFI